MKKIKQIEVNSKVLDFVLLNLNDENEMASFYNLFIDCFGLRANVTDDTFRWFSLNHPDSENLTFALIDTSNNNYIAAYGLLPGDALVRGKFYKYCLCTNVMTHPNYAGQGLFKLIGKEALDFAKDLGFWFCFGVPNEQAVKGHLGVGWEIVKCVKFYELLATDIHEEAFSKNVRQNDLKNNDLFYLDLFNSKYKFTFNRTSKWLNWRLSKPYSNYTLLSITSENESAYIVIKKYNDTKINVKKLHIVDFGYTNQNVFIEILKHVLYVAKNEKFDLINLWQIPTNSIETNVLGSLNFKETNAINPLIIHKLGNIIDIPANDWHITLFDNDVY